MRGRESGHCAEHAPGKDFDSWNITIYEGLIIQDRKLAEADKILFSMVLQPGVDRSAILTWSGPFFTADTSLLKK